MQRCDHFVWYPEVKSMEMILGVKILHGFLPHIRTLGASLVVQRLIFHTSHVALALNNPPASAEDIKDAGSIPGSGRFPGGGDSNLLQYSCLKNPMNRGARVTVHRVAKSWMQLKWLSTQHTGGPRVKTLCRQYKGHGFDPWLGS